MQPQTSPTQIPVGVMGAPPAVYATPLTIFVPILSKSHMKRQFAVKAIAIDMAIDHQKDILPRDR